jgi:ATP synthase protein I
MRLEIDVPAGVPSTVAKVLAYQLALILLVSLGFAIEGWHKAFSSAMGGLTAFIPNLFFALRISGAAGQDAGKMLRSFYIGESVKLLLTALMFILMMQIPNIDILPLLAGFISALSVFWFALLMR